METIPVNETPSKGSAPEKQPSGMDKRILYMLTKPFLFPGETEPRSEMIQIRAIDEKTYEKVYTRSDADENTQPRRIKRVDLNHAAIPTEIKNVKEYFDYLIKEGTYRCKS